MRSLKPIFSLIVLTLFLTACSSDDSPAETDDKAAVIGTYTLSAVNVSPAQDVNDDGVASTNLLDEMTCINGTITINSDTSWNLDITRTNVTSITGGLFFIDCGDTDASGGSWTFSNNQLNLNGGFEATVYSLNGDTLTQQIGDDLPGFQSFPFTK